jgi:hypothetical protein
MGVTDKADPGFAVTIPNSNVTYNARYAPATSDPPAWAELTTGDLRAYAQDGTPGMGFELTLGETLFEAGTSPWLVKLAISGSTLATEWSPSTAFLRTTTGTNLFDTWVARMRAFEASTGRPLAGVVVNLGTNDAFDSGHASRFADNMTAFIAAARTALGADLAIVWIKTNPHTTAPFVTTVIAGQVAVAAADPRITVVDIADIPLLSDGLHYDTDGYLTIGQRAGFAMLDQLGAGRRGVCGAPAVVGWGPAAHGDGAVMPRSWPGTQVGDREYLVVTAGLQDAELAAPAGWSETAAATSTFSGLAQRMAIYEREVATLDATGRPPATTVADTNNLNAAKIFTVRGPRANPTTDVAAGTASQSYDRGPIAVSGVTTTAANDLVLVFAGGYSGSGSNALTIAMSQSTTLQSGLYNVGSDFQAISLATTTLAAPGPTAAIAAASTTNLLGVAATVAVQP